ncbi:Serine/threonine-protein kinase [Carpediemonas membranifera]|uniref:Serine/threonine-protein kinase n=1 Tax=Carpediemonas membranifera TaxID=201153 RepID=A0A8J6E6W9_9EUKA|nr:Serine/threonine-protein kinase [Carpediemonas membranifera]|eukprot:KAG9397597.1 Serine/threonine-protein kinase [Carpediemonas membranifera]
MELTEPAVTVSMVRGRLEADHENNRLELALEVWNSRFTVDMEGVVCIRTLTGHEGAVNGVATSPDGSIVTASYDGTVKQWDATTSQCIRTMKYRWHVWCVAISPDGSTIASGGDKGIKLWDTTAGWRTKTLSGHTDTVRCLAFSSDGRTLVSGSEDSTAKVWDVETEQCRQTLTGHSKAVYGVAISIDGSTIHTGSQDRKAKQWSSATGECIRTMDHGSGVITIAVSPDDAILVSGGRDSSIKFWDSETGQLTRTLNGHIVCSLAFSPDGRTLLSGSAYKTSKQWDVATGALIRTFSAHNGGMRCVAFSRNGSTIVSGSSDNTIKVWSALTRIPQFLATVNQLCSSPVAPDADIAIDPGDSEALTSDLDRILLHFIVSSYPRSFTMTLSGGTARVWLDENKFAETDSEDATLAERINLYNNIRSQAIRRADELVSDFCSRPPANASLALVTIHQLRQVVTHVTSHKVPSNFTAAVADIASAVTLTDGQFSADRHALEISAVLSEANCRMLKAELADTKAKLTAVESNSADQTAMLSAELAGVKATLASFCASLQTGQFTAANRAADISTMLEGHPLLSAAIPTHDGIVSICNVPSPAGLISRLGQARRQPETRIAEYKEVIAQARAGVEALEAIVAAVNTDYQAASDIVDGAAAFESLPSLDEMARVLKAADNEVLDFPTLAPELQARYATLRAFLQPAVRETWQWALSRKELGDDTSSEERTIREMTGLAAEAEVHLAAFAEADDITAQLRSLGDYQRLKNKAEELDDELAFLQRRRKHAQAAEVAAELEAVNASIVEINAVLARRTPQLVRLCPELEALTAPSASLFAELREMGLAHLMDLPEMRADLSLSDFAVESKVSENRALCQIVTRNGQTFFAKTFKLDAERQRKLCDREAGILSRMAHSPAVPKLHFVLVDSTEQTCTIVMERLESHLRDTPADSPDSLRRLLRGLLTAIHDLHSAGVCHRDLKPENVMLREGHPVLVDFETASNMDAVNATATGVNIGTLAFSAPEEIAARNAGKKLSHREQQAADVYHAGLTTLALMTTEYTDFCRDILSLSNNKALLESSTANHDNLCAALLASVTVPDALRDVLSGMLATHPEARWSVRRALADGLFTASANELDPEVDLNAMSSRFANAHAFVDDIDRARLQMLREDPVDIALADDISASLASIAACEEDLFAIPATLSGDDSAKALPDLVVELPRVAVRQVVGGMEFAVPIFREGTLVFTADALDMPLDDLRPVLLGLGRVLQLMLLDGITLPADMASDAWLVALTGGRVDLGALMPIVDQALQTSLGDAIAACPLEGFEGAHIKAYGDEVRLRFTERMQIVRNGMAAKTQFSEKVLALTAAQLRALLVRPNPLTVAAVLAPLRFPADSQGVQDALRAVLEDDETRRRFAFHVFGGQLPQPSSVGVTLHDHHRVYADCAGGAHLPRLEDADQMHQAVLDSAPATSGAAADFYVIPRRQQAYSHAEIRTLVEQNDILQTCRLVTLGRGAAVDVPVIRRCPTCGELTSREGDLDRCKMSTCPCGQDFCHKCLLRVANHREHMAHFGGECEMAPRQVVDLPEGVARQRTVTCPHCHRSTTVSPNRRQVTCRGCRQSIDLRPE